MNIKPNPRLKIKDLSEPFSFEFRLDSKALIRWTWQLTGNTKGPRLRWKIEEVETGSVLYEGQLSDQMGQQGLWELSESALLLAQFPDPPASQDDKLKLEYNHMTLAQFIPGWYGYGTEKRPFKPYFTVLVEDYDSERSFGQECWSFRVWASQQEIQEFGRFLRQRLDDWYDKTRPLFGSHRQSK